MSLLEGQDIINEQQLLLSGYSVNSGFFDYQVVGAHTVRKVLEMLAGSQLVAIEGVGCNDECAPVSVVALRTVDEPRVCC